ncbi:MAG: ATP phosphoribosyltransferase [Thermoanaerobaculia bacterium]
MIRLALPKGRYLPPVLRALEQAGLPLPELASPSRRLVVTLAEPRLEIVLLRDWDLPLYVERGAADCGVVGSDVLAERGGELLVPLRFASLACRLSWIGRPGTRPPGPGAPRSVATKYPRLAGELLAARGAAAELVPLSGAVEVALLLGLADLALDIVETGRTIADHGLVEIAPERPVEPCFVVQRAAFQIRRREIEALLERLEAAGVAA